NSAMYFGATQSARAFTLAAVVAPDVRAAGMLWGIGWCADLSSRASSRQWVQTKSFAIRMLLNPTHPVASSRLLSLYSPACATRNWKTRRAAQEAAEMWWSESVVV